jgi:hypothetical protein
MDVTITVRLPGKLPFRRRWAPLPVLLLVLAMPLAVLASDRFSDVLTTNPAHGDINAIATAGITAGCNPPTNTLYCPADAVTRQQMASFLHRALGRVAYDPLESTVITSANNWTKTWTHTLTSGLPSSALAGAAGFIKTDAVVVLQNGHAGFDCLLAAWLTVDGVQSSTAISVLVPDGGTEVISLTAAKAVTASGSRTIGVVVQDQFPCSEQTVYGDATSTYFPFGSSGNNNP